jgi:hypothetical protein
MKTTSVAMKIIRKTDRNTRALAKVVSAIEYIRDNYAETQASLSAVGELKRVRFDIIQERRNLRVALWRELSKQ